MSFLNPLQKLANSLFGSDETNGNNSNSTLSNSNSSAASPIAAPKPKQSFWSSGPGRAVPGSVKQVRGAKYPPLFSPPDSRFELLFNFSAFGLFVVQFNSGLSSWF
jgi:hypothetical protein